MEVTIFQSPHTAHKLQLPNRKSDSIIYANSDNIIYANFKQKMFATEYLQIHIRQTKYEKLDSLC